MIQEETAGRTFFQRANDLRCRAWHHRVGRSLRARLRHWCAGGLLLADDPRVLTAWRRGWDADHYLRLRRWHDGGFRPRVVYDIGAHTGLWAAMCQAVFAPDRLFLFEPQRACHDPARKRQPPGADWQIVPVALGDEEGARSLFVTQNRTASSLLSPSETADAQRWETNVIGREEVQVSTLDHLVQTQQMPAPDLIKIDVQGYEARVLAGGNETVAAAARLVVEVAVHPTYGGQALLPEVLHDLSTRGFELDDLSEAYREWPGPMLYVDLWLKRSK